MNNIISVIFMLFVLLLSSMSTGEENISNGEQHHSETLRAVNAELDSMRVSPDGGLTTHVKATYGSLSAAKKYSSGKDGEIISTLGFYKACDGGGADYILRDHAEENGVTVHGTESGQYLELVYGDEINVLTVGLIADGYSEAPTDNWMLLQLIADHDLYFPDGKYFISGPVEISRAVTWRSLHSKRNASRAQLMCGTGGIVISSRGVTIDGVSLLNKTKQSDSVGIRISQNNQYVTISDLSIDGFRWGVYLDDDCWGARISNCNFLSNKEALYIKNDANEVVVRECYFLANENGIHTVSSSVQNLVISECLFQNQSYAHLNVETRRGIAIFCSGCYFENHAGNGVIIGEKENNGESINLVTFVGDRFHFSADEKGCSERGLYLGNVANATIIGCSFSKNASVSHDYIETENVDSLFMEGNYFKE